MLFRSGALRDGSLVIAVGDRDQFFTPEALRTEEARLAGLGLAVDMRPFAGPHVVDRATLVAIA